LLSCMEIIGSLIVPRDRYFVIVKLIIKLYRAEPAGDGTMRQNKRSLEQGKREKERGREGYVYEAICQSSHALLRSLLLTRLLHRAAAECFNQQPLILRGEIVSVSGENMLASPTKTSGKTNFASQQRCFPRTHAWRISERQTMSWSRFV